jgi:hypothetical protein
LWVNRRCEVSVFSPQAGPQIVQQFVKHRIINFAQATPTQNNYVQGWYIRLKPEGFANPSFYPVALNRKFQIFFGKYQSDPGMVL